MPIQSVGGTHVPGFVPNQRNWNQDLFQNLVVFMKLMEAKQENQRREAERQDKMKLEEQKLKDLQNKNAEEAFTKLTSEVTGINVNPQDEAGRRERAALQPYIGPAERAFKDKEGLRRTATGGVAGEPSPFLINVPGKQVENVREALSTRIIPGFAPTGLAKLVPDLKNRLMAEGMKAEDASNLVDSGQIKSPTEVQSAPTRLANLRETYATTAEKAQRTEQAAKEAPLKQRELEAKTLTAESLARKTLATEQAYVQDFHTQVATNAYKLQQESVKSAYAPAMAELDAKIKNLDVALKTSDLSKKPLEKEKLQTEINNAKLQGGKLYREISQYDKILTLADQLKRNTTTNPDGTERPMTLPEQTELERQILLTHDPSQGILNLHKLTAEQTTAAAKAAEDQALAGINILKNKQIEGVKPEDLQGLVRFYNQRSMDAALIKGLPREAKIPIYSIGNIGSKIETRLTEVPAGVVQNMPMYLSIGTAPVTSRDPNDLMSGRQEVEARADKLAWHLRYHAGFLPPGSEHDLIKLLNEPPYNQADPEVLKRAAELVIESAMQRDELAAAGAGAKLKPSVQEDKTEPLSIRSRVQQRGAGQKLEMTMPTAERSAPQEPLEKISSLKKFTPETLPSIPSTVDKEFLNSITKEVIQEFFPETEAIKFIQNPKLFSDLDELVKQRYWSKIRRGKGPTK